MRVHEDWLLTCHRAAVHLPTATAVVADLHLGYSEVRRQSGDAVPLLDASASLADLRALLASHALERLIIAGDLYERGRAVELEHELMAMVRSARVELVLVAGNHDHIGAACASEHVRVGLWRIVHGDGPFPRGRFVQGHVHPCIRWSHRIAAPCFLVGTRRLILPAFSNDAAGVNVLRDPQWRRFRCAVIAGEEVLDFGWVSDLQRKRRTAWPGLR